MYETRKSNRVRRKGMELYQRVFRGRLLDIGCGEDMMSKEDFHGLTEVVPFDLPQGDANLIDTYFPPDSFDVVFGSQVLEHLLSPYDVLPRMLAITKPGGHVVMSVPHYHLYEQGNWPSVNNPDHKTTWGIYKPDTPAGVGIVDLLNLKNIEVLLIQLCDTNYDYTKWGSGVDQTFNESDGVEAWCEFVVRKR